jgi:hypothetical protein
MMAVGIAWRGRRPTVWLALALFSLYLVAVPPHLVHHLFDQDHGRLGGCPHLAQSQHTPELQPDLPGLARPAPAEILSAPRPGPTPPTVDLAAHLARAPPPVSPSR